MNDEIDWEYIARHLYGEMKAVVEICDCSEGTYFSLARARAFESIRKLDKILGLGYRNPGRDWRLDETQDN